jgi:NADH:ubiquinone oxidoreductase subunit 4 (subunit M)
MIFFILNFIDQKILFISIVFVISHGFLSSLMFFVVELIYRRFLTRNINELSQLWVNTPILSKIIFIKILIFLGLPGFVKFSIEVIFYMFCFSLELSICFFLFFVINIVGMVGYARC